MKCHTKLNDIVNLSLSTRKPSIAKLVGAAEKIKKVPSYVTW